MILAKTVRIISSIGMSANEVLGEECAKCRFFAAAAPSNGAIRKHNSITEFNVHYLEKYGVRPTKLTPISEPGGDSAALNVTSTCRAFAVNTVWCLTMW